MRRERVFGFLALVFMLALPGLASTPAKIPDPPRKPHAYVIGIGDVLDIDVWHDKQVSRVVPVRPDGAISLPLAGQVQASGRTPSQLQASIATKLSHFIDHPAVTVIVEQVHSRFFSVLGNVLKPGRYPLLTPTRVLQALAEAGGFTPFANLGDIILLRSSPHGQIRYRINYNSVIHGRKPQENMRLRPGDTLIVP